VADPTPLRELLRGLTGPPLELLLSPPGGDVDLASVGLLDADDLVPAGAEASLEDLCLLVGVSERDLVGWFGRLAAEPRRPRPRAVLSRLAASPALTSAAQSVGVALVRAPAAVRWDDLLASIRAVLEPAPGRAESTATGAGLGGADTDLYGLAQTVAALAEGMVSIEDDRSRVLAYSASDDTADELRTLSILGRVGPEEYLQRLRDWGVFDRLQRSDDVIEVPADTALGIRRRLVVGIRGPAVPAVRGQRPRPTSLGTIWVQEGEHPLAADTESVLRGASAIAARLITRAINAPTTEAVQIQRLLGARGGGVDVVSLAAALSLPTTGPAVVIGFSTVDRTASGVAADLSPALRLHASAFSRESLVTTIGQRVYVLIPRTPSLRAVTSWTGGVIERMSARGTPPLRAAVAAPVDHLTDVAAARAEVDRVLDQTSGDRRVTTLADSRTPVLLGEMLDLLATRPELADPRVAALVDYDRSRGSAVRESLEAYLGHVGDVRTAAQQLHVHPNTLRYRIARIEEVTGRDLSTIRDRVDVFLALQCRPAPGNG
jgi:DNA-binding PucR family transcriptional regulator